MTCWRTAPYSERDHYALQTFNKNFLKRKKTINPYLSQEKTQRSWPAPSCCPSRAPSSGVPNCQQTCGVTPRLGHWPSAWCSPQSPFPSLGQDAPLCVAFRVLTGPSSPRMGHCCSLGRSVGITGQQDQDVLLSSRGRTNVSFQASFCPMPGGSRRLSLERGQAWRPGPRPRHPLWMVPSPEPTSRLLHPRSGCGVKGPSLTLPMVDTAGAPVPRDVDGPLFCTWHLGTW